MGNYLPKPPHATRFNFGDIIKFFWNVVICQRPPQEPTSKSLNRVIAASHLYVCGPVWGFASLVPQLFVEKSPQSLDEDPVIGPIKTLMIVLAVYLLIFCLSAGLLRIYSQAVCDGNKKRFILSLTAFMIFWVLRLACLSFWFYKSLLDKSRIILYEMLIVSLLFTSFGFVCECICGTVFFSVAANYYQQHLRVSADRARTQERPPAIEHVKPFIGLHSIHS